MVHFPALKRAATKHSLVAAMHSSEASPGVASSSSAEEDDGISPQPSRPLRQRTGMANLKRIGTLATLSPALKRAVAAATGSAGIGQTDVADETVAISWEHFSTGMAPSVDDPNVVMCTQQQPSDTYACAVGTRLPAIGQSELSIRILASDGSGQSVLVGLAEDTGAFPPSGAWGRAVGLAPWNGKLFGFPDARTRDRTRAAEVRGAALMRGDLRGIATDATIHLRVDSSQRKLWVKVGEGDDWTLARDGDGNPLELGATPGQPSRGWRPFVRCARAGDKFALSATLTYTRPTSPSSSDAPARAVRIQRTPRVKVQLPPAAEAPVSDQAVTSTEHEALRNELQAAKEQLELLRRMYITEKEKRQKAEEARDVAERRYEREKRMVKRLTQNASHDPEAQEQQRRVKEIEAGLLREAMLHNEKVRSSLADNANAALAAAQGNSWRASALRASTLPRASLYSEAFSVDDRPPAA